MQGIYFLIDLLHELEVNVQLPFVSADVGLEILEPGAKMKKQLHLGLLVARISDEFARQLQNASEALTNKVRALSIYLPEPFIDLLLDVFYEGGLIMRFKEQVGDQLLVFFLKATQAQAKLGDFMSRQFLKFAFEFPYSC